MNALGFVIVGVAALVMGLYALGRWAEKNPERTPVGAQMARDHRVALERAEWEARCREHAAALDATRSAYAETARWWSADAAPATAPIVDPVASRLPADAWWAQAAGR